LHPGLVLKKFLGFLGFNVDLRTVTVGYTGHKNTNKKVRRPTRRLA